MTPHNLPMRRRYGVSYLRSNHDLSATFGDFGTRSMYIGHGEEIISHSLLWVVIISPCPIYLLLVPMSLFVMAIIYPIPYYNKLCHITVFTYCKDLCSFSGRYWFIHCCVFLSWITAYIEACRPYSSLISIGIPILEDLVDLWNSTSQPLFPFL